MRYEIEIKKLIFYKKKDRKKIEVKSIKETLKKI
jgi:hypothetical protein